MTTEEIRGALTGLTGVLPRRAVLLGDGRVADKLTSPLSQEIVPVSLVCEILRRETREPVYPRHTPNLLSQCLSTNDPGAWRALLDDATTADLDAAAMTAFWSDAERMDRLVDCLVNAMSGMHVWLVIRAMQEVLPAVDQAHTAELGSAFQRKFPAIVRTVSRRVRDISVDMRGGAITVLGKLMAWCNIPTPGLTAMMDTVLVSGVDEVLRLFMFAPVPALVDHDPSLVEKVLARAERASHSQRYPSCSLLALMTAEQLGPFAERVLHVTQRTLDTAAAQGTMDPRLGLVCGVLARSTAPGGTLVASLAHALTCMSVACTSDQ